MAPIRSILASRAVITSLSLLCCLALFLYTIDIQPGFHKNTLNNDDHNVNNNDRNNNNLDVNSNLLMPSHELKGVDGDKVYHGRPKRSTRHILEQSEGFYKRILRQRKQWLDEQMFGTRYITKKMTLFVNVDR